MYHSTVDNKIILQICNREQCKEREKFIFQYQRAKTMFTFRSNQNSNWLFESIINSQCWKARKKHCPKLHENEEDWSSLGREEPASLARLLPITPPKMIRRRRSWKQMHSPEPIFRLQQQQSVLSLFQIYYVTEERTHIMDEFQIITSVAYIRNLPASSSWFSRTPMRPEIM